MSEPTKSAGTARLDLLKTLGDNTRYAIYLELARSPHPLATAEIADTIGLHPNTVRPHLDRMRDVGLVEVNVDARGAVGRPQHRYSLAPLAPSLGFEPPVMPMLARLVTDMAERLGANATDAQETGRVEGSRRADRRRDAPSSIEAMIDDLDRLGFDPVVVDDPDRSDSALVAFAHCPFGEVAEEHPAIVCNLHRGIIDGFADELGDLDVTEFTTIADRSPCQMRVRVGAGPPE